MNKVIAVLAVICLGIFCTSCSKNLGVNELEFKPKLVVNGVFNQDEYITVQVYGSRNILLEGSAIDTVENALVQLFDVNDALIGTFDTQGDGSYTLNTFLPKEGEQYTLRATADNYQPIRATSYIPTPMVIHSVVGTAVDYEGKSARKIEIELYDIDAQDNFYVWEVLDQIEPGVTELPDIQAAVAYDVLLESSDLDYEQISTSISAQSTLFLSDNGHSDDIMNTTLYAFNSSTQTGGQDIGEKLLIVRLLTVSADLYEYYRSVEFSRLKGNINSSVTQPINIYSNVHGGLGIFAGYAQKVELVN